MLNLVFLGRAVMRHQAAICMPLNFTIADTPNFRAKYGKMKEQIAVKIAIFEQNTSENDLFEKISTLMRRKYKSGWNIKTRTGGLVDIYT